MSTEKEIYEVAIIGAGVSGTALLHCLSNYTNINRIALIEKNGEVALVNSHRNSNSQTLHFGDIETNYTLEKAKKVSKAANMVKNYLLKNDSERIYTKYNKMVLAVGEEQVEKLKDRYREFKELFPELKLIDRKEIEAIEPKILKEREISKEIAALFTNEGYTIDFQKISQSFLNKAIENTNKNINIMMNTKVKNIFREENIYHIQTNQEVILAKTVAVTAGAHSLLMAKSLGYGHDYALLSVAGNFYFAPGVLNGKVYTVQLKGLPFAAIHGDPEVYDQSKTRFGPTAKVVPLLERHNYSTVLEYLKTAGFTASFFISLFKILANTVILKYIIRNLIYDIPIVGKRLFLEEVRKIVPSLKFSELKYAEGYGGIRPQVINLKTKSLELGEAKLFGDNIIFNITPSPGASTCLQNAEVDTEKLISFLGDRYNFDKQRFLKELEVEELEMQI